MYELQIDRSKKLTQSTGSYAAEACSAGVFYSKYRVKIQAPKGFGVVSSECVGKNRELKVTMQMYMCC
jgi:hypothetical protein